MQFNVEISELAERQYGDILSYIANQLENPQAVKNVIDDFDCYSQLYLPPIFHFSSKINEGTE